MRKRDTLPSVPLEVSTRQPGCSSGCSSTPRQLTWGTQDTGSRESGGGGGGRGSVETISLTLMLFLKVYPGRGTPFFLSMGSLKMTSCSKRKTLLSLALDRTPFSCSPTKKVSCWSSFPWAVILPWKQTHRHSRILFCRSF